MPTTVKIRRSGTASATPSALEHGEIAINYADGKVFWKNASDVITSFTFQSYALASHTHSISDVTGLQTALDGKASSSHTHSISDVTGLQTALDGKASSSHTHAASDITSGTLDIARIANDAVTYAKIQNVSATNRILGRSSAGAGDVEELDAATARTVMSVQPTASPAFTGAATFANTGDVVPLTVTNAGTANSFVVNDASGDTSPFVIDASGNVGVGTASPSTALDVAGTIRSGSGSTDPGTGAVMYFVGSGSFQTVIAGAAFAVHTGNNNDRTQKLFISSTGTATFAGQVRVNTADSATALLVNGATKGVRFATSSTATAIEGVDSTGTGSYQPLIINGSTVTIQSNGGTSAITVSTSQTATFAGQVLVTAGSGSSGSYKPGMAISGDDDTGIHQVSGNANTLSIVTDGTERVRVDASGNVGIGGSPNRPLLIVNNGSCSMALSDTSTGGNVLSFNPPQNSSGFAQINAEGANALRFVTNAGERMRIASDGVVTMPDVYEDTVGATNRDLFIDSTGKLGYVSSIRESKTDIVTLDDVSWLSALSPVSYRYRKKNSDGTYSDEADGVTDYGLIAEDVEAVRPELCFYDQVDGEPQLRGVTYSKLITPMLRYIQQLEARIAALEERLNG
jgi:hypothetical protein